MRTGHLALVALLAFGATAIAAAAQNTSTPQQDALAAASRRALEAKKDQPKAAKVFTNDNLPTNGTVSVVGQSSAAPAAAGSQNAPAASQSAPTAARTPEENAKKTAQLNTQLEAAQERLAMVKKDLDIDQRRLALDQQSYQNDPNHDQNKTGAAGLQSEIDDISAKQVEVDAAQKVVDDLRAKLSQAGSTGSAPAINSSNSDSGSPDSSSTAPAAQPTTKGGISLSTGSSSTESSTPQN